MVSKILNYDISWVHTSIGNNATISKELETFLRFFCNTEASASDLPVSSVLHTLMLSIGSNMVC